VTIAPPLELGRPAPESAPEPRSLSRRRPRGFSKADLSLLVVSGLSAVCFTWFLFYQLTVFSGAAGFVITSILAFLGIYYLANRQLYGRMAAADRVIATLVTLGAVAVAVPLAMIIGFLVERGYHLISWHFLTTDQRGVTQLAPASTGGVSHAIVGTLEQVGLAVVMGAPAGVLTAIFLNEVGKKAGGNPGALPEDASLFARVSARRAQALFLLARAIRVVITAMSAIPSIVAGLFILVVIVLGLGYGLRGLAGSLALAILLLPNICRTTEEVLKVVHGSLREASLALGATEWRTVWSVVLPTARTGVVTAVLLGIARVVGETAPLLLTIGSNSVMNPNPFAGQQESLPVFVYTYRGLSRQADIERAFAAGLVLVGLVLVLFVIARIVGNLRPGSLQQLLRRLHLAPKEALS